MAPPCRAGIQAPLPERAAQAANSGKLCCGLCQAPGCPVARAAPWATPGFRMLQETGRACDRGPQSCFWGILVPGTSRTQGWSREGCGRYRPRPEGSHRGLGRQCAAGRKATCPVRRQGHIPVAQLPSASLRQRLRTAHGLDAVLAQAWPLPGFRHLVLLRAQVARASERS